MTKLFSVVLDTNVLISAIIFGGTPRQLLILANEGSAITYTSPQILLELSLVLLKKFNWERPKVEETLKTLSKFIHVIEPVTSVHIVKSDPTDNKIIECALEAKVDFIITGDKHLLNFKKCKNINIVKPADFLVIFEKLKN